MTCKKSLVTQEEAGVGISRRGEEVASYGRTAQTTSHTKRKAMDQPVVKRARKVGFEKVEEDHSHVGDGAKDVEFDVEKDESSGDEDKGGDDGDDDNEEGGDGDDNRESDGKGDGNDDHDSEKLDKTDHGKRVIAKMVSVSARYSVPRVAN
ncbi:hypothetical protein Sjap_001249 [Stephania japonica]|uniref:Uncharacterized protein n=1 Tax=Stephania japonica TaxID=461633 RepID=A0AAP0KLC5_9MAGN